MKRPSDRIIGIIKKKLNRFGDTENYYYGGHFSYYEIKVLLYYFKLKVNDCDYATAKRCIAALIKGENGRTWFYFHKEGNKKIFKELGLEYGEMAEMD